VKAEPDSKTSRTARSQCPSERDLQIWAEVKGEFLDWGYTGLVGRFQAAGHRLIGRWAETCVDKMVLEIGCGHGHHLQYGRSDYLRYIGLDIEHAFLRTLRERFPGLRGVNGDAYALPFRDQSVDCVLSVYCLEHLRRLPDCLEEIWRVLKPTGALLVGLPAEGGFLYEIGRRLTSQRYMERGYGIDYSAIVHWEHWNTCPEVIKEISHKFSIRRFQYLPLLVPTIHFNVVVALEAFPKTV
jgi:SAM-dependent methyltransferase